MTGMGPGGLPASPIIRWHAAPSNRTTPAYGLRLSIIVAFFIEYVRVERRLDGRGIGAGAERGHRRMCLRAYALMTAIRDAGGVYSFAGHEASGRIDLGGCAAGA